MSRHEKHVIVRAFAQKYAEAKTKKLKGKILDEVTDLTGYYRKHAIRLLHNPPPRHGTIRRSRPSRYQAVLPQLKNLWTVSNFACGKLLVPFLPQLLDSVTYHKELSVSAPQRGLLLSISPATVDRLLRPERKRLSIKGRSGTKPGTLLKNQIPVRIFTPWDERQPGFIEIDLLAHCGDSLKGEYINTLNSVDIATSWTEPQAFMGRSQAFTLDALRLIEDRFPFPLKGIDSDNDGVFINVHLVEFCKQNKITFTRSRPFHKNDQAHVEQKNWSSVRKYTGHKRFETQHQLMLLNQMYSTLSVYINFFQPTMKLQRKEHRGARVHRVYDKARTPYQRVLEHPSISDSTKEQLKRRWRQLNPVKLIRQISHLMDMLARS